MNDYILKMQTQLNELISQKEISACMREYMKLCDELSEGFNLDPLLDLFTADAIWEGKGERYSKTFGKIIGLENIRVMFEKYTRKPAHFILNVHFLTNEIINIGDNNSAHGQWLLLQTSTFNDGRSQLSCAFLDVYFRFDERWKINHFTTSSRFNRPISTPWDSPEKLPVPGEQNDF